MIYLIDTNILSFAIKDDALVIDKLNATFAQSHQLAISAMTYFEIKRGLDLPKYATKEAKFQRWLTRIIVFDLEISTLDVGSRIWQQLRNQSTMLEDADCLIVATALQQSAILVTDNTKHFARVPNLKLENWIERT